MGVRSRVKNALARFFRVNKNYDDALDALGRIESKIEDRRETSESIVSRLTRARDQLVKYKELKTKAKGIPGRKERKRILKKLKGIKAEILRNIESAECKASRLQSSRTKNKLKKRVKGFASSLGSAFSAEG